MSTLEEVGQQPGGPVLRRYLGRFTDSSGSLPSGKGLDTGQPGCWAPPTAPFCSSAAINLVAGRLFAVRFNPPRNMAITKIVFVADVAASADDPCDVGIYSANGQSLLGSSGPTTGKLNGTGLRTCNLQAPVSLVAGTVYYGALGTPASFGGTAAQLRDATSNLVIFTAFGAAVPNLEQGSLNATGSPLPGSIAALAATPSCPILALLE